MILGLEIGMLVAGLIALIRGRLSLVGKSTTLRGVAARVAGVILMLPLPVALAVVLAPNMIKLAPSKPFDPQPYLEAITFIELWIAAACFFAAVAIWLIWRERAPRAEPVSQRERRVARPESAKGVPASPRPSRTQGVPLTASAGEELIEVLPVTEEEEGLRSGLPPPDRPAPQRRVDDQPRPRPRRRPQEAATTSRAPMWLIVGGVAGVLLFAMCGGLMLLGWSMYRWANTTSTKVATRPIQPVVGPAPDDGRQQQVAEALRQAAAHAAAEAEARREAERARQMAEEARQRAAAQAEAAAKAKREAAEARALAKAEQKKAETTGYLNHISQAERELLAHNPDRAAELLDECRPEQRGWEWHYLKRQCQGSELTIMTDDVYKVVFSPDGKRVAKVGFHAPTPVKVWDAVTGQELLTLQGHTGQVHGFAYSSDGRLLLTSDGQIRVWSAASGEQVSTIKDPEGFSSQLAMSPDGSRIAAVCGTLDRSVEIKLWDARSKQVIRTWKNRCSHADDLAFTPDGKSLAFAGSVFRETKRISPNQSEGVEIPEVVVWDIGSGDQVLNLPDTGGKLAFSGDGSKLATLTRTAQIKIWDPATGKLLQTIRGRISMFSALAFSPDGLTVASGDGDKLVRLWDVKSGREIRALRGHFDPVVSAAFSPDGKHLVTAGNYRDKKENRGKGDIKLWSLEAAANPLTFTRAPRWVLSLAFSPDGERVVTGHGDNIVRLWEARTGHLLRELRGHTEWVECVAYSPDGRHVASATAATAARGGREQPGEIKIWDTTTGQQVLVLTGHRGGILGLAYSPDGKRLAAGGWGANGEAKVWDPDTGKLVRSLDTHEEVYSLAFSHDGNWLFTAGKEGVNKWDATTGVRMHTFSGLHRQLESMAISRDSRLLAARGRSIYVWNQFLDQELFALPADVLVKCLAFSGDGKRLAAACGDNTVKIWDVITGQLVFTLRQSGAVDAVAFSPDGNRLASGGAAAPGEASEVKIWDATPLPEPAAPQGGK